MFYTYKYIVAFVLVSLTMACESDTSEMATAVTEAAPSGIVLDQKQFDSSKFELGGVVQQSFSRSLNITGSVHLPEKSKAAVSTLMSGTVGAINLLEGQWVNKGQKLFSVTNPELINIQEEYLIAHGQLEYLTEEYNRQVDLFAENISTENELLKAKSELATTQARHGALHEKLKLYGIDTDKLSTHTLVSSLRVLAPISGYITDIAAIRGMYLEPNQVALKIANNSNIHLELSILEKDASLIRKGQAVTFTLQANPEHIYQAKVELINRSINANHMINVHCYIEEGKEKDLVPGMFVNAKLILDDYQAYALPEEALVKMNEAYYALSLSTKEEETMTFEKVMLETGEKQDGYIEIKGSSLIEGEFLVKGAYFLIQ